MKQSLSYSAVLFLAIAGFHTGCKTSGSPKSAVKDDSQGSGQAAAATFRCGFRSQDLTPYYMLSVQIAGDKANVSSQEYSSYHAARYPESTQPASLPMEAFSNSTIYASSKLLQVSGNGDGDAGYINIRASDRPNIFGGSITFPNSPAFPSLEGDGRRYNLECTSDNFNFQSQIGFPDEYKNIMTSFGDDIAVGDESGWHRISGVNDNNYKAKIGKRFFKSARDIMTFKAVKTKAALQANFRQVLGTSSESSARYAQEIWDFVQAGNGKRKVVTYSSEGEDGMWLIYGFMLYDTSTGKALMLFTEGSA